MTGRDGRAVAFYVVRWMEGDVKRWRIYDHVDGAWLWAEDLSAGTAAEIEPLYPASVVEALERERDLAQANESAERLRTWQQTQRAERAEAEVARKDAALRFYADPKNYESYELVNYGGYSASDADKDAGQKARAALAPQEKKP